MYQRQRLRLDVPRVTTALRCHQPPDGRRRGVGCPGIVITTAGVQGLASLPDLTRELRDDTLTVNSLVPSIWRARLCRGGTIADKGA